MERKTSTAKRGRTPEEIVAEQKRQAAKDTAARKVTAAPLAPAKAVTAVSTAMTAAPDTRTAMAKYFPGEQPDYVSLDACYNHGRHCEISTARTWRT